MTAKTKKAKREKAGAVSGRIGDYIRTQAKIGLEWATDRMPDINGIRTCSDFVTPATPLAGARLERGNACARCLSSAAPARP